MRIHMVVTNRSFKKGSTWMVDMTFVKICKDTVDGSEIWRSPGEVGSLSTIIYKNFSAIPGGCLTDVFH